MYTHLLLCADMSAELLLKPQCTFFSELQKAQQAGVVAHHKIVRDVVDVDSDRSTHSQVILFYVHEKATLATKRKLADYIETTFSNVKHVTYTHLTQCMTVCFERKIKNEWL